MKITTKYVYYNTTLDQTLTYHIVLYTTTTLKRIPYHLKNDQDNGAY